jgi:tetratricopeptide (TPR) repeat protein
MQAAVDLIASGNWPEAAASLENAACLHAEAGRDYDQARCLQLAATLRRSSGQVEKTRSLVDRAANCAQEDRPLAISIAAERAETSFAGGQYEDAVSAWNDALDKAREAGLKADGRSALLRRRAAAFPALRQIGLARVDFDLACELVGTSHGRETAGFVRTEEANLLLHYGYADDAEHAQPRWRQLLRSAISQPVSNWPEPSPADGDLRSCGSNKGRRRCPAPSFTLSHRASASAA